MQKVKIDFSIILPCLNEEKTLEICIKKIKSSFVKIKRTYEIVVADNGSADNSIEIAKQQKAKIVRVKLKGYGSALQAGIRSANGEFIIMADADNSYNLSALHPFVTKLTLGYDLVIGNRFSGKIKPGAMPWLNRYVGNPILSLLGRLFFSTAVRDFHCGLRAFTKNSWLQMDLQTTGMEYASEMIIKASYLKLRTTEVPITYYRDGRSRKSNLKPWRDGWRHLRFMLLFAPNWLYLYPGLTLMFIGTIIFSLVIFGQFKILNVAFDVHTLLISTVLIIIGFQVIFFGIFTKIYLYQSNLLKNQILKNHKIFKKLNLELGLICGFIIILVGLALLSISVFIWFQNKFGPLNYAQTLRILIPGVFLIQLGIQLLFNSFFLSFILLPKKSNL